MDPLARGAFHHLERGDFHHLERGDFHVDFLGYVDVHCCLSVVG